MVKLLELLIQKQTEEGLSNQKFAAKLGISRSLWELTQQEKQDIGWLVSLGVVQVYPDLIPELLHYLRECKPKETTPAIYHNGLIKVEDNIVS